MSHMNLRRLALPLVLGLALGACSFGPGAPPSYPPGASPAVTLADLTPAQRAVATALAYDPRFAGAIPFVPATAYETPWYQVSTGSDGLISVVVALGWGDCTAGCQYEHRWTYRFSPAGGLYDTVEAGTTPPPAASPGDGPAVLSALLLLGPACPVPPVAGPVCVNAPAGDATLTARSLDDPTTITGHNDPRGLAVLRLPAGRYLLTLDSRPSANLAPPEAVVVAMASGGGASLRLFFSH